MTRRLSRWLRRYLPAELAGTCLAVVAGVVAVGLEFPLAVTAYIAAWSENVGFYAAMLVVEYRAERRLRVDRARPPAVTLLRALQHLAVEFGPAEVLDSLLIRPASMYLCAVLVQSPALGIVAGKFLADGLFYVPVVITYELRLRRAHRDGAEAGPVGDRRP